MEKGNKIHIICKGIFLEWNINGIYSMGGWISFSHKGIIFCKEYYSAIKKEKSCHLLLMDGTWGHYAEWNKSGKERQMLYGSAYKRSLKKKEKNSQKQNRFMVARGGGGVAGWWGRVVDGDVKAVQRHKLLVKR